MKSKAMAWAARTIAVLVLTASVAAQGQLKDQKFEGVINAYSPQTSTGVGPWEIRGPWSLKLKSDSTKADFSAAVNMEYSDGWVMTTGEMNFDPNGRGAHTHHITVADGEVTLIPNGFQVTGTATFTKNGGPAPASVTPSPVVIQITGGSEVEFSNITLTFQSPGSDHFGTAPLPGVVRKVKAD